MSEQERFGERLNDFETSLFEIGGSVKTIERALVGDTLNDSRSKGLIQRVNEQQEEINEIHEFNKTQRVELERLKKDLQEELDNILELRRKIKFILTIGSILVMFAWEAIKAIVPFLYAKIFKVNYTP